MEMLPIMSVSGIRGIVDKTFTSSLCAAIAYVQSKYLGSLGNIGKGGIIVARDTRPTGPSFASAIFKGICAAGATPLDIGIAPTPTACVAVKHFNAAGGVIITASHNPGQYNGYKMVHPSGRLFKGGECDDVYREFGLKNFPPMETMVQADCQNVKKLDAITPHIEKILREVDVELIKRARMTIAIDSINGAAGVIFPQLLSKLGVAWVGVHNKIDGDFVHNPEPRPEHLTDLSALMKKTPGLWGGFVFDPDADRLALMGEHGEPVTEEMTLVLACDNILSRNPTPIATNLSTSMMVDDVARKYGVRVIRTRIGEANVVEGLLANGCGIGGEGNGGVIYPAISTVRDGLAGIALVLELMAKTKKTVMELVKQWPSYPLVKEKITCENKNPQDIIRKLIDLFKNETIDVQDGVKIVRDYGWVHIRPSNTEPIIRCYAEATTIELANQLVALVIDKI